MEKWVSKQREEAKEQYYCWWVLSARHLYNILMTLSLTLYFISAITYIYIHLELLEPVNVEPIDSTSEVAVAQVSIELSSEDEEGCSSEDGELGLIVWL